VLPLFAVLLFALFGATALIVDTEIASLAAERNQAAADFVALELARLRAREAESPLPPAETAEAEAAIAAIARDLPLRFSAPAPRPNDSPLACDGPNGLAAGGLAPEDWTECASASACRISVLQRTPLLFGSGSLLPAPGSDPLDLRCGGFSAEAAAGVQLRLALRVGHAQPGVPGAAPVGVTLDCWDLLAPGEPHVLGAGACLPRYYAPPATALEVGDVLPLAGAAETAAGVAYLPVVDAALRVVGFGEVRVVAPGASPTVVALDGIASANASALPRRADAATLAALAALQGGRRFLRVAAPAEG
jgi:hypothetical protein